ncbi:MAG: hypothetical protein IPO80_03015 [Propionibacteriaceae bacterium]|nr:hypothetical protein [Propionibacteriaceae bacterium]
MTPFTRYGVARAAFFRVSLGGAAEALGEALGVALGEGLGEGLGGGVAGEAVGVALGVRDACSSGTVEGDGAA